MDKGFSLLDVLIIILKSKKKLFLHFLGILVVSLVTAYLIPKNYKATTLFLPPFSDLPRLSPISLSMALNLGGDSPYTPQQIEALLDSRKILDVTIKKFDLTHVYKTHKYPNRNEKALKKLRKNIQIKVVTESGLTQNSVINYSLSVIDKDGQRAADIANFLLQELNRVMNELSRDFYGYSVDFIKGRLDSVEIQKRDIQRKLAEFQKSNKVYSPEMKEQVMASVGAYAELNKEKILAEIERNLLLFDREKNNREVQFAQRKIKEIERKMSQIEDGSTAQVLPGLSRSVDIAYNYLNMVQEAEVLVKLELLLRQQYEEARIKNARHVPSVRIVDPAVPPEWKNSPKKALVVGVMVGVYMFGLLISVFLKHGFSIATQETLDKLTELRKAVALKGEQKR